MKSKDNDLEKKIKKILKGKTGDLKLHEDVYYERKSSTYGLWHNKNNISGKYIKAFINENSIYAAGFAGIKERDDLTTREKQRLRSEDKMSKPQFRTMFKNYEAFKKSSTFSTFKKPFKYKDLIKIVALLRLYNELYLKDDRKGCKAIKTAVEGLQIKQKD